MDANADLDRALARFRAASREMRLQLLLAYARKLPELPSELIPARDAGLNRIQECQSPVYLWVATDQGKLRIHADVPQEAPTVRGFVSFLVSVLDGHPPSAAAGLPATLLEDMGLAEVLGPMRTQGLGGVIRRVRSAIPGDTAGAAPDRPPEG